MPSTPCAVPPTVMVSEPLPPLTVVAPLMVLTGLVPGLALMRQEPSEVI